MLCRYFATISVASSVQVTLQFYLQIFYQYQKQIIKFIRSQVFIFYKLWSGKTIYIYWKLKNWYDACTFSLSHFSWKKLKKNVIFHFSSFLFVLISLVFWKCVVSSNISWFLLFLHFYPCLLVSFQCWKNWCFICKWLNWQPQPFLM